MMEVEYKGEDAYAGLPGFPRCFARTNHMMADTSAELHAMAAAIGVARKWCQHPGTPREHYDICLTKRAKAVKAGAKQITWRELGEMSLARRQAAAAK